MHFLQIVDYNTSLWIVDCNASFLQAVDDNTPFLVVDNNMPLLGDATQATCETEKDARPSSKSGISKDGREEQRDGVRIAPVWRGRGGKRIALPQQCRLNGLGNAGGKRLKPASCHQDLMRRVA